MVRLIVWKIVWNPIQKCVTTTLQFEASQATEAPRLESLSRIDRKSLSEEKPYSSVAESKQSKTSPEFKSVQNLASPDCCLNKTAQRVSIGLSVLVFLFALFILLYLSILFNLLLISFLSNPFSIFICKINFLQITRPNASEMRLPHRTMRLGRNDRRQIYQSI